MDQGIIQTWKAHYQRSMMRHVIQEAEMHPNNNPYDFINLLHTIRWDVDAWTTAVKPSTLEHYFDASQVKIHGPFQPTPESDPAVDNIHEVEEDILECIRVIHPSLQLSPSELRTQFITPSAEIVEDPIDTIEHAILATYLPNEVNDPDSEALVAATPPPVTPLAALSHIEQLLFYSLQAEPTANIIELQHVLNHEKKQIEVLELQRRCQHVQRRITDFLGHSAPATSSSGA